MESLLVAWAASRVLAYRFCCKWWAPKEVEWQTVRVLCLGLDGAGKTLICASACSSMDAMTEEQPEPTVGFNTRTVKCEPHWKLQIWDIGGSAPIRQYWTKYITGGEEGLIWVIDASDRSRFDESREALQTLLEDSKLRGLPVLILANKADIADVSTVEQTESALGVHGIDGVHVQLCSARTGQGVQGGLTWLCTKFH